MTPQVATEKLYEAVVSGSFDDAIAALNAGADPNARNEQKQTALHLAASLGLVGFARLLLDRGADPNARNDQGQTPLHLAVSNHNYYVAKALVENGAEIQVRDNQNMLPQDLRSGNHPHDGEANRRITKLLQDALQQQSGHSVRVEKRRGDSEPQIG